ncbi:SAM-dependent methyltransferase [Rhizobium azooxidifex]|uniref:SAM-dependent methyltransferase n=1 Tax=Mycoplana azooxidifex TaxID=1636188 RepID=A0A7W6D8V6_9HYPH|nr:class I SAM-dependent methyltransferase [Mycoplana azooxidifex]MBB3978172.1 SAM-dependent methyltransferase [Mycoplana azooxidifex]
MFLSSLARSLKGRANDLWLNIGTAGTAPAESVGHVYYATISYRCIRSLLDSLDLSHDDRFVDVGCGKGRVVCLAARHRLSRVTGVEYSTTLANEAKRNSERMRGRKSPVQIHCKPAEDFDYSDSSVLYFFNPFEAPLLDSVLQKARADRRDRPLRMAFVMESPAQRDVFARHTWLSCYNRFEDIDHHLVAFYRNS